MLLLLMNLGFAGGTGFIQQGRVVLVDDSYGVSAASTELPRLVVVDDSYGATTTASVSSRVVVVSN